MFTSVNTGNISVHHSYLFCFNLEVKKKMAFASTFANWILFPVDVLSQWLATFSSCRLEHPGSFPMQAKWLPRQISGEGAFPCTHTWSRQLETSPMLPPFLPPLSSAEAWAQLSPRRDLHQGWASGICVHITAAFAPQVGGREEGGVGKRVRSSRISVSAASRCPAPVQLPMGWKLTLTPQQETWSKGTDGGCLTPAQLLTA